LARWIEREVKMLDIIVIKAKVIPPFTVELGFIDGTSKRVNLENCLYGEVFEPLKNQDYFTKMRLEPGDITISWPNDADFAPEFLYELEPEEVVAVHSSI
jgi:hypothetical protein